MTGPYFAVALQRQLDLSVHLIRLVALLVPRDCLALLPFIGAPAKVEAHLEAVGVHPGRGGAADEAPPVGP